MMRRCFVLVLPILLALAAVVPAPAQEKGKLWVFVGTYSGKVSKGIYRLELDLASGKLSEPVLAAEAVNPSFLAIHPSKQSLYAVSEIATFDKKKTGSVRAFALDARKGTLSPLNEQPSGGTGPCHLVVDQKGKNVLVANYGGGSCAVLPLEADGCLREPSMIVQHKGKGALKRQSQPYAHSINLDAANRFAFVADLGLDKVVIYRFDPDKGTLQPNDPAAVDLAPGAGPRHFAFHPSGKNAYVINEIDLTITAFAYDAQRGALTKLQTISTIPAAAKPNFSTAEVVVHPSGKFVYGSNRGQNTIAIFKVDPEKGTLTAVGHQGHLIDTPRNFAIDPTGQYLLAASQGTGKVVVFRIDQQTGALTPTGSVAEVPSPVCVRMIAKG